MQLQGQQLRMQTLKQPSLLLPLGSRPHSSLWRRQTPCWPRLWPRGMLLLKRGHAKDSRPGSTGADKLLRLVMYADLWLAHLRALFGCNACISRLSSNDTG